MRNQDYDYTAEPLSPSARSLSLIAIIGIAVAVRTYHLDWGLPDFIFNDTRLHFLRAATRAATLGDWTPDRFVHPPLYPLLISAATVAWSTLTGNEVQIFGPGSRTDLATIVMIGRAITVALCGVLVGLIYLLGRRLIGTLGGLLAALFFALAQLHVLENHRVNVDTPMLLFAVASAHQAIIAIQERRSSRLLLAYALAAASGCAKYTGYYAGTLPLWATLVWPDTEWRERVRLLFSGGLISLVTFLLLMSPVLFDWDTLAANVKLLLSMVMFVGAPTQNLEGTSWVYAPYLYMAFVGLPFMLGWPVYVASLAGLISLAWCDRSRFSTFAVLMATIVPCFIILGGAATATARYYLPLAPSLVIAAAAAIENLRRVSRIAAHAVAALLVVYSATLTTSQIARLAEEPQKATAAALRTIHQIKRNHRQNIPNLNVAYPEWANYQYDSIQGYARARRRKLHYYGHWLKTLDPIDSSDLPIAVYRDWMQAKSIDAIILPNRWESYIHRKPGVDHEKQFYKLLVDHDLGFQKVSDASTRFFTQSWYDWADPSLSTVWVAGIEGYKLYLRNSLVSDFDRAVDSNTSGRR